MVEMAYLDQKVGELVGSGRPSLFLSGINTGTSSILEQLFCSQLG